MARLSNTYLTLLDKWLYGGYPTLNHFQFTPEQKLRTQIVYEAYQVWLQNKQIDPMDIMRQIANRTYQQYIEKAKLDPETAAFVEKCGIELNNPRTIKQLYNDVEALNHIIGTFTAPVTNIEKAKVVDASDWLIRNGMKTGDGRDVYKGADLKMRLNKDFDEREAGYEDMANTDVTITDDVSIVKPDRTNYTDEEKKRIAKRYGISTKSVIDLVQKADGSFGPEEPTDIFIDNE